MNKVLVFLKEHKYLMVALVLVGISITLGVTYSNYIVTSSNHKAAEMYIGELKYSMEIDGSTTNTLTVPTGETIIDVKVNNLNPVDTYYKLLYLKNTNITVKYYESTKDTNEVITTYNKPNDSITSSNSNTIKLQITNSSTSSQNIALTMKGGYITNTLEDIITPSTYSEIALVETPSTNTYFCKTNDTLTQGLKYVNGQYTYAYKQEGNYTTSYDLVWQNISNNGWGVQLTDKENTDDVTSKLCTYLNNKAIISMAYMFSNSQALRIDLSNFNTSSVYNMEDMFLNSKATSLDLSSFDASKVTLMNSMFSGSQATALDLSNFDTSNVFDMNSMFANSQVKSLDLSSFDTSKVENMSGMFDGSQATSLDLSSFNTSNVTLMGGMFQKSQTLVLNLKNFDTSNVFDMNSMFANSQVKSLDLSSFDTSKVENMSGMFDGSQATSLDLSSFNTSNVTLMSGMFAESQAKTLDLSNFNTSNVTNMSYMFYSATNLKTIYISDKFNTSNVTTSTNMFYYCTKLVGGAGTKYNSSYVDKTYARIDGGTSNPGYFTDVASKPSQFSLDDWGTIVRNVKSGNTNMYKIGDTKEVNLGSTYGTHTLRVANTSTPSECSTSGFSQTACGFVLEFADIIAKHNMNDTNTNVGGWPATSMRTFVNNDIYNALPSELRNAIIDTTVVSGHGSTSGETNFTSTDKLYLLSTAEVWAQGSPNTIEYDTARDVTRQLDYYKNLGVTTTNNKSGAIKKSGTSADNWWLRAARSNYTNRFLNVYYDGDWNSYYATNTYGVAPAFRLG